MASKTYPAFPHPEPEAIVVFCGDPRFQSAIASFIADEFGLQQGQYLPFSVPGGVASLSEPMSHPKDFKVLKEGLAFYLERLGSITKVIIINHEDCKKYHAMCERLGVLKSRIKDIPTRQRDDLKKVAGVIAGLISKNLEIKRYYIKFANAEHTQVEFEPV